MWVVVAGSVGSSANSARVILPVHEISVLVSDIVILLQQLRLTQRNGCSCLSRRGAHVLSPERNITGSVGPDGFVGIRAITSTISGSGDQGADPNRLAVVFDSLSNTDPAVAVEESFFTLRQAEFGEVLRGVSFTPGTDSHGR